MSKGYSWVEKLAFVGMFYEEDHDEDLYKFNIKIRRDGGVLVSHGGGDTLEKAIENAAWGQNIDWYSVETKMTERDWAKIAHI